MCQYVVGEMSFEFDDSADGDDDKLFVLDGDDDDVCIGWWWWSLCDQVAGQGTTRHLASLRIHCSSGKTSYLQNQESRLDFFVSIFIRCFKLISDVICFGASIKEDKSFATSVRHK